MNGDCSICTGLCCRYFAVAIQTPEAYEDYDELWWALMHQPVEIYVENAGLADEEWTLRVHLKCEHLATENRCTFYAHRPNVCREYSTEECEMSDIEDEPVSFWFENADQFRRHCEKIGVHLTGKNRGKAVRRRRGIKPFVPFQV